MNITTPKQIGASEGFDTIETVSPEGIFCDTLQVPSGASDIQLN